jgi:hypothetical protein
MECNKKRPEKVPELGFIVSNAVLFNYQSIGYP